MNVSKRLFFGEDKSKKVGLEDTQVINAKKKSTEESLG